MLAQMVATTVKVAVMKVVIKSTDAGMVLVKTKLMEVATRAH